MTALTRVLAFLLPHPLISLIYLGDEGGTDPSDSSPHIDKAMFFVNV